MYGSYVDRLVSVIQYFTSIRYYLAQCQYTKLASLNLLELVNGTLGYSDSNFLFSLALTLTYAEYTWSSKQFWSKKSLFFQKYFQTLSDQAEILYDGSLEQSDICRAFKNELRIALGPPGVEISTIKNSTFSLFDLEKCAIFAILKAFSMQTFDNMFSSFSYFNGLVHWPRVESWSLWLIKTSSSLQLLGWECLIKPLFF